MRFYLNRGDFQNHRKEVSSLNKEVFHEVQGRALLVVTKTLIIVLRDPDDPDIRRPTKLEPGTHEAILQVSSTNEEEWLLIRDPTQKELWIGQSVSFWREREHRDTRLNINMERHP
ncbi:MAG: hypothetical protein WAV21_00590 [Minisyncoccia bacterium]